ncbi:MAG: hypothetical protein JWO31_1294 [Phycisphaerales bacterium]|nr:hypothetical protein [Phycisphaerales bacterium]
MLLFYGTSLYGGVDRVAGGGFHVATQFFHLYHVPVFPRKSFVVFAQEGRQFRGTPIGLSAKSVLVAWGRTACLWVAAFAGLIAVMGVANAGPTAEWLPPAVVCGIAVTLLVLSYTLGIVRRASFARACALGREVGLSEDRMAEVSRQYGQAVPTGFDVIPTAAMAAVPAAGR